MTNGLNVHIVCVDDGHIVPRMARWLVDAYGWNMSARPDPAADVNYYMPYAAIAQGVADTRTAAWFTHFERGNTGKEQLWRQAEQAIDLPLVTSPQPVAGAQRITPGIDRTHFTPDLTQCIRGRIGVAGIGSPRKGVHLAARLFQGGYGVVAAGSGWDGVLTHRTAYDAMPYFYHRLDVFLCTSLIEGIPAPPLEALACGIKVVVPNGVGMMDDLPERPGVRHYEVGDYRDMRRAANEALTDSTAPEELRTITEPYSITAWCESNLHAIQQGVPVCA